MIYHTMANAIEFAKDLPVQMLLARMLYTKQALHCSIILVANSPATRAAIFTKIDLAGQVWIKQ